jgi:glycerol kinase
VPVERPEITETTALGAALLAGIATGVWHDAAAATSTWRLDRRFEPTMPAAEREVRMSGWRRAVERSRGWAAED